MNIATAAAGRNDPCPCGSGQKFKKCCMGGITHIAGQKPSEAPPQAVMQKSADADILVHRGFTLYSAGKLQEALDILNQAIAISPNHAAAYLNRGYVYNAAGNWQAMIEDFNRAKDLEPTNESIHCNIAKILYNAKNYYNAIQPLRFAIQCKADYEEAFVLLADCYYRIGDLETARDIYQQIQEKFPNNVTDKLELTYMLPPILSSEEEIDRVRTAFMQNLDRLMQENFTYTSLEAQFRYIPFYHIYHGRNNRELMEKLASFFYKSSPDLAYVAPHAALPCALKPKIRIGFVLDFMSRNLLGQFVQTLFEGIANSQNFETVLILTNATQPDDPIVQALTMGFSHYVLLPRNIATARKAIAQEQIDILIYTELALTIQSYFLAMARLAPIQCNLGMHPITSGLKTIDYNFSYKNFEPDNGQEHYTEKLMLFDSSLAIFKRIPMPDTISTREQLGLPQQEHLYCCPVLLYKLHPDIDKIFARILERDPRARIILFDYSFKTLWREKLEKRFANGMSSPLAARITFLPRASKERFLQILLNVDCILDTVHFSFGATAYQCLGLNLPFVTWPGNFACGRVPYMLYKQMNVTDLIAATHEDYVELALRLANDKTFHTKMVEKIRLHSDVVFDNRIMIDQFAGRLKALYIDHIH